MVHNPGGDDCILGRGVVPQYGCFLKWWYPQNTPKWSFLVGKPIVVGYHHFWKHPSKPDLIDSTSPWLEPYATDSHWTLDLPGAVLIYSSMSLGEWSDDFFLIFNLKKKVVLFIGWFFPSPQKLIRILRSFFSRRLGGKNRVDHLPGFWWI